MGNIKSSGDSSMGHMQNKHKQWGKVGETGRQCTPTDNETQQRHTKDVGRKAITTNPWAHTSPVAKTKDNETVEMPARHFRVLLYTTSP